MPDDRRAWHRGGACLFNRQPVTARTSDLPARDIDVPCAAVRGVRRGHAAQYASLLRPTCFLIGSLFVAIRPGPPKLWRTQRRLTTDG